MNKPSIPPIAIMVTLPKRFFEEYGATYDDGLHRYENEMKRMNEDEDMHWIRVMKNLPRVDDLLHVYTVYGGTVQHKCIYGGSVRDRNYRFMRPNSTIKEFNGANAILLYGPVVIAPTYIPCKGFQGFRYIYESLF